MKLTHAHPIGNSCARPFLKWAGGKTQLLFELLSRFPTTFNRYHEPFLGGGAVFFALQPQRAVLSDINPDLIAAYAAVRDHVDDVIQHLSRHRADPEHFYKVRAMQAHHMQPAARAARTIYLNRTCFNGLYRVNQSGKFNVPYGHYTNPTICNRENLLAVANILQRVVLRHQSYDGLARQTRRGDLVYLDPPYDPVSSTSSFTNYSPGGFGREQQRRLAALYARLAARGVHVVLSNADTPFVRELYRGFQIDRVMARRLINSHIDRRGAVGEVIVTVAQPKRLKKSQCRQILP